MYRNLAYTALFAFSMYICYKTYQTQRKIREGFDAEFEVTDPKDIKKDIDAAVADAALACADCPIKCTPDVPCTSSSDPEFCRENVKKCKENIPKCKELCAPARKKK